LRSAKCERQRFGGLNQGEDARNAEDVCDLVRVSGDRRGSVRQDGTDELFYPKLCRLELYVRVDQPWGQCRSVDIHRVEGVALPPSGNDAVRNRQRGVNPFARERAEDAASGDQ
jgi:hypothetical protein